MKATLIGSGLLVMAVCGAASARGISYDGGQFDTQGTVNGATASLLLNNNLTAVFGPGTTTAASADSWTNPNSNFVVPAGVVNVWEYNWGTNVSNDPNGDPIDIMERVTVELLTTGQYDFNFGYESTNCSGETASFSLGTAKFSESNPCANPGALVVTNGVVTSVTNFSSVPKVSAPEIDPNSAVAALTILLGGLAIVRGARKSGVAVA
jgi:hypothetical protein